MIEEILPLVVAGLIPVAILASDIAARPAPLTREELSAWVVAASRVASHGQRELPKDVADAQAAAAIANPIIRGDNRSTLALASLEVSVAWFETGGQLVNDPKGSNDHGHSHCWGQVWLPNGARTAEGWTGAELRSDPEKCATVVVRLIKASLVGAPSCNRCGLVLYARGRDTPEGRALSRNRVELAERMLREVPAPRTVR